MSPTEERKETIDFTENYYTSDFVMVVKKGSTYENAKSIQDFSGAKITSQLNTSHYDVIEQIEGVNKQTAMESFPAMRVAFKRAKLMAMLLNVQKESQHKLQTKISRLWHLKKDLTLTSRYINSSRYSQR